MTLKAALDVAVTPRHWKRLPNVEQPESDKRDDVQPHPWHHQKHQPLCRDLVDHDPARSLARVADVTCADAHHPVTNTIAAAMARAVSPQASRISQAQGRATSEAQVPGAPGSKPMPKPVAISTPDATAAVRDFSERQPHGRDRLSGDALAAAGKAELFGRRRFDADPVGRDAGDCRDGVRAESIENPVDHRASGMAARYRIKTRSGR